MYRLALRITLNSQEAEDVVQDVIIKLWKMGESLNDIENLEAYSLRMTRNLALDRQRMKVNQNESLDEGAHEHIVSSQPSADTLLERQERIENYKALQNAKILCNKILLNGGK